MSNTQVKLTFEITMADGSTRPAIQLSQEMVKIGKHPASHVLIDDESVSRMHAYVEVSPTGEVIIMDLGSAAGTFVNGEKVTKKRFLVSGDEAKVGNATIRILLEGATGNSAGTSQGTPKSAAAPAKAANPFAAGAAPSAAAAASPFGAPASPFSAPRQAVADPFAKRETPAVASQPEDDYEGYYALVASGPAVPSSEVETSAQAIEVMVMWGERDILQVTHLAPPRNFLVGEGPEKPKKGEAVPDFFMEKEFIGGDMLVMAGPEGGGVAVNIPLGGTITVRRGGDIRDDASIRNSGEMRASTTMPGAMMYQLREGEAARVKFKGFVFETKSVAAGFVPPVKFRPDPTMLGYIGGVATFIVGTAVALSFIMPDSSSLGGETLDLNNRYVQALIQAAEQPPPPPEPSNSNESEGGSGQAAADASGEMGRPNEERTGNRSAVAGDAAPEDWRMARESAEEAARNNVVTNAVASIAAMFSAGPTSAYGADQAVGGEAMDALGNLLGAQIGSSGGAGGLGLTGTGSGGGGTGIGTYGMGNSFGTLGRGGGGGTGSGYGRGGGDLGDRGPVRPVVRPAGNAAVQGGLTADQIRRVIQRNISQVQHCYEQGLQRNPSLTGRVTVAFIITPTGSVGSSTVADNSLGDTQVGTCISGAVRRWAFPQPDPAGPVSVRFPFNLSQSGG